MYRQFKYCLLLAIIYCICVTKPIFATTHLKIVPYTNWVAAPPYITNNVNLLQYNDYLNALTGNQVYGYSFSSQYLGTGVGAFSGTQTGIGLFYFDSTSDIGIDSGLLLTTGMINQANPAYTNTAAFYPAVSNPAHYNSGAYNGGFTLQTVYDYQEVMPPNTDSNLGWFWQDEDFKALIGGEKTYGLRKFELVVVPQGKTLRLQYVFASEEYPLNTAAFPNDVVGIFISGAGYNGWQNIAIVPGTDSLAVGVNTINDSSHSNLFVNNLADSGQNVIFNGFTKPLYASAQVTPCDTYHIKIGVAEGARHSTDTSQWLLAPWLTGFPYANNLAYLYTPRTGMYNSAIFIKKNALTSGDSVWAQLLDSATLSATTTVYSGCAPVYYRIHRQFPDRLPLTVHFLQSGSATPGLDYATLPDSVIIPAYDTFIDVPITALSNSNTNADLYLKLKYVDSTACYPHSGFADIDSIHIMPSGFDPTVTIMSSADTLCMGNSITLNVTGDSSLHYHWQPSAGLSNANEQEPQAFPSVSTIYSLSVTNNAGCYKYIGTVSVTVDSCATSTKDIDKALNEVNLAPNPFNSHIQIISTNIDKMWQMKFYTNNGRLLLSDEGKIADFNKLLSHNMGTLASGIYLLELEHQGHKRTFKVIKD